MHGNLKGYIKQKDRIFILFTASHRSGKDPAFVLWRTLKGKSIEDDPETLGKLYIRFKLKFD